MIKLFAAGSIRCSHVTDTLDALGVAYEGFNPFYEDGEAELDMAYAQHERDRPALLPLPIIVTRNKLFEGAECTEALAEHELDMYILKSIGEIDDQ